MILPALHVSPASFLASEWTPPPSLRGHLSMFLSVLWPDIEHRMWQNIVENHSFLETKTHLQGHGFHMIAIFASKLSFFYHWKLKMLYMLLWILPGFWYSSVLNQRSIMISWRKSKPKTNKLGCHPFESCNVTSFLGSQKTWQPGRQQTSSKHLTKIHGGTLPGNVPFGRSYQKISKVTLDYSNPELLKPSKKTVPNHIDWRINKFWQV